LTQAEKWAASFLGYQFSQPELLERALTHKSRSADNNERLEFLGDAVLGFVVAEALYAREQFADEGALSRLRALLVRRETLAELASELQLGDVMLLGNSEYRTGGQKRTSILADGLEAVFGAILLDSGVAAAREVILRVLASRLANLPDAELLKDAKTILQEKLQGQAMALPTYRIIAESGPAHARVFEVACRIEALDLETVGTAASRRIAEQVAAANALARLEAQS
jgi:ribonuclease-3